MRGALLTTTAIVILIATAGCFATSDGGTRPLAADSSAVPDPVSTATATPTPSNNGLPADVLFRITATATLPSGAKADLTQTVYQPAPLTAVQEALILRDCGPSSMGGEPAAQLRSEFANSLGISTVATATLQTGSPAWSTLKANELFLGFVGSGAFTGDYEVFQSYCAPGAMSVPGVQSALTLIPSSNPADGPLGWARSQYGFSPSFGDADNIGNGDVTIVNCAIQLGSVAAANPISAAWPAAAAAAAKSSRGCSVSTPAS